MKFLVSGTVEQYHITPAGNKVTVNVFKPPAFFPMSWAMNHTPNSYFFAALTDAEYHQVSAAESVKFLEENPDVALNLLARVYRGTDALLRRLVLAASGFATGRLIHELIIEAYRFGEPVDTNHISISLQQDTLASRSGLARETVSRELRKLTSEGLVRPKKGKLILNIKKLEEKLNLDI